MTQTEEDVNIFSLIKKWFDNRCQECYDASLKKPVARVEYMLLQGYLKFVEFSEESPIAVRALIVCVAVLFFTVFSITAFNTTGVSRELSLRDKCPPLVVQGAQYRYLMDHGCEFGPQTQAIWGAGQDYYQQLKPLGGRQADVATGATGEMAAAVGRCMILSIMGDDEVWFKRLDDLRKQSGCIVLAYVEYKAFEMAKLMTRHVDKGEMFLKTFGTKYTTLDMEFSDLVKVLKPWNVMAMVDTTKVESAVFNGFKYSLNSGRVNTVLWLHDPSTKSSDHQMRNEVELLVTEGFGVYLVSGAGHPHLDEVEVQVGPYLRVDGKFWDDSYMRAAEGNVTLAFMAVHERDPFNKKVIASYTLCRPKDVLRAFSGAKALAVDKGWTETTNTHEVFDSLDMYSGRLRPDSTTEMVDGICECQGVLFQQAPGYCGVFAPPPPAPETILGFALWYDDQDMKRPKKRERGERDRTTRHGHKGG